MSKRNIFSYYFRINFKSIQGRITLPFVLFTAFAMSILYFSNYYHRLLYAQKDHIQNNIVPVQAECGKLLAMVRQSQYSFSYFLYAPNDSTSEANRLLWRNEINPQRDKIRALLNAANNEEAKSLFTVLNKQISEINQIQEGIERERKTRQGGRYVHYRVVSDLTHAMLDFERTLANIINIVVKQIKDEQREIDNRVSWFYLMMFGALIFAFLVTYLIGMRMFAVIFGWIRELRDKTEQMSEGNLPADFTVQENEFKRLSAHSNTLLENLRALRHYAIEIGKGNFSMDTKLFGEKSPLGTSLNQMGESLQKVYAEERRRNWITEGLTDFAEVFRTNSQDLNMLCRETLKSLVQYLEIVQGAVFLVNRDDPEAYTFELKASYANSREKFLSKQVPVYDGLLGRIYQEKEKVFLRDVPDGYAEIVSGIGSAKPRNLLVIPLLDDERVVQGAIEIATLVELEDYKVDFLEKLAYSLASTIAIASISLHNQKALENLQNSAERLKQREAEMETMMNEMNDEYQRLEIRALENQRYADRLQAIFRYLPEPLILTDFAGNIQLFNPTAERIWGYKAKDIMGKDYRMLMAPDAHIEFLAHSIQVSQDTEAAIQPETKVQVIKKDGTKQTLALQHQEVTIEGILFHIWLFGSMVE